MHQIDCGLKQSHRKTPEQQDFPEIIAPAALAFTVLTSLAQAADQAKCCGSLPPPPRPATTTRLPRTKARRPSPSASTSRCWNHYLARPAKLVPRTLEALPAISDNGATFLCKVQKGVFFADDAAFQGKPRELTAADYAYSLKRLLDPAVKSPWLFLVEARSSAGTRRVPLPPKPASSTTTRRCPASKWWTATRCASG